MAQRWLSNNEFFYRLYINKEIMCSWAPACANRKGHSPKRKICGSLNVVNPTADWHLRRCASDAHIGIERNKQNQYQRHKNNYEINHGYTRFLFEIHTDREKILSNIKKCFQNYRMNDVVTIIVNYAIESKVVMTYDANLKPDSQYQLLTSTGEWRGIGNNYYSVLIEYVRYMDLFDGHDSAWKRYFDSFKTIISKTHGFYDIHGRWNEPKITLAYWIVDIL